MGVLSQHSMREWETLVRGTDEAPAPRPRGGKQNAKDGHQSPSHESDLPPIIRECVRKLQELWSQSHGGVPWSSTVHNHSPGGWVTQRGERTPNPSPLFLFCCC